MWGVPFSNDPYGFAVTCSVMLIIGAGQWWFYRRLHYLEIFILIVFGWKYTFASTFYFLNVFGQFGFVFSKF